MISSCELLRIARRLQNASGDLWRLIKFKDEYKDGCTLFNHFELIYKALTYEEALINAMAEMEEALKDNSDKLYVEFERQHLFDRSLLPKDN